LVIEASGTCFTRTRRIRPGRSFPPNGLLQVSPPAPRGEQPLIDGCMTVLRPNFRQGTNAFEEPREHPASPSSLALRSGFPFVSCCRGCSSATPSRVSGTGRSASCSARGETRSPPRNKAPTISCHTRIDPNPGTGRRRYGKNPIVGVTVGVSPFFVGFRRPRRTHTKRP